MNPVILLFSILFFDFIIRSTLFFLNKSRLFNPLSANVNTIYKPSNYRHQQLYHKAVLTIDWLTQLLVFIATISLIYIDFPDWLDYQIRKLPLSSFPRGVVFFAILGMLLQAFKIPFELIKVFIIDRRFQIIKPPKTFVLELFLKGIVTLSLGSIAYGLLLISYAWLNESFWYMSWILFTIIFLTYVMLNQRISYFFSSDRPVTVSNSLGRQLKNLLKDFRIGVKDILIKKHHNKKNNSVASLALWGRKGKIILDEQVFAKLTENEIKAVIIHEAAHYKRYHIFNQLLTTLLQIGLLLLLLGVSMQTGFFQQALGATHYSVYMGLLSFVLLFSPASLLLNLVVNSLNRYFEKKADEEVIEAGLAEPLVSALKKLASEKIVNLTPHPLYVMFYYQHPDLETRIRRLNRFSVD
jgi:STE24 endopeptidase